MTRLYFLFTGDEIADVDVHSYLSLLPAYEQKKILLFREKRDACLSLFGKLLLLKSFRDFDIDLLHLHDMALSPYQKPFLPFLPSLHFSISHCHQAITVAVSNEYAIGTDVEKKAPVNIGDFRNMFRPDVFEMILNTPDPIAGFYHFWTCYEAALKAHGKGFLIDLKQVKADHCKVIVENETWYTRSFDVDPELACAVAVPVRNIEMDIQFNNFSDLQH